MKINNYGDRDYIAIPKFNVPEMPEPYRCDEINAECDGSLRFFKDGAEVNAAQLCGVQRCEEDDHAMAEYIAAAIAFAEEHRQFRARHDGVIKAI